MSHVSGAFGAVSGASGTAFKKGNEIVNNAGHALGTLVQKGLHPVVKKTAKKVMRQGARYVIEEFLVSQTEGIIYAGIEYGTNGYIDLAFKNY